MHVDSQVAVVQAVRQLARFRHSGSAPQACVTAQHDAALHWVHVFAPGSHDDGPPELAFPPEPPELAFPPEPPELAFPPEEPLDEPDPGPFTACTVQEVPGPEQDAVRSSPLTIP
jgi:hypothetical protein